MKIDMSHGNGGRETTKLINEIFAKNFDNSVLKKMEDAAVVNGADKIAFTTDSFVVKPLFFQGGDIGRLAMCGTVNDLLMVGATPKYISAGFIIEEGADTADLERISESMSSVAKEANVKIVCGDTKVIDGNGGVYINTSGVGLFSDRPVSISGAKEGDCVILSGTIGDHHACIMSHRMGIKNDIQSDAAPLNAIVRALLPYRVRAMRDVTRGGLATVLNEIAQASGCGVEIDELALPISEQVGGLCKILGLDPLYMGNEGKMVAVVPQSCAKEALKAVRRTKYGKDAAIIAQINPGSGVIVRTPLGGRRSVGVLAGEGLPRIC